jgi:hypothetical protein
LSNLPSAIAKRDLLHGAKNSSHAQTAQKFESEGWISDAIDFYNKAEDRASLLRLQNAAAAEGNAFLVLKVVRLLKQGDSELDAVRTVAAKAEAQGMVRYAISAYEKLGNEAKVRELRESVKGDGDIVLEDAAEVFIPDEPLADG